MYIKTFVKVIFCVLFLIYFRLPELLAQQQERNIKQATVTKYKAVGLKTSNQVGLGPVYRDRQKWDILYKSGRYKKVIVGAEQLLKDGIPQWSDKSYLSYSTGVASEEGKDMMTKRVLALSALVWAECLENKGRFIESINTALLNLSRQKSWVFPSQDSKLLNFNGKNYTIDLCSANYANHLAQTLYLLDDKIKPEVRVFVMKALQKRIFDPMLKLANSNQSKKSFLTETSNWNPVCLAGVVGATMAVAESNSFRERVIDIANSFSDNYLVSFLDDGYCSEGVDYYNYGFGNYLMLREELYRATNGKIDILSRDKVKKTVRFLVDMVVVNGLYPTIGDSPSNVQPSYFILNYLNKKGFFNPKITLQSPPLGLSNINLTIAILDAFQNIDKLRRDAKVLVTNSDAQSSFDQAGVFVLRSRKESHKDFGIVIKGGNNNEHHNHNDLGTYSIAVGNTFIMGDPGKSSYTKNSFGSNRYKYKTMSSYGHPAPTLDGVEQKEGLSATAKVLSKSFNSSGSDKIVFDLKNAYELRGLSSLEREFVLDRTTTTFQVKTTFSSVGEIIFEDAITTKADFTQIAENKFLLKKEDSIVEFSLESGLPLHLSVEKIDEGKNPFKRISIKSTKRAKSGSVTIKYKL